MARNGVSTLTFFVGCLMMVFTVTEQAWGTGRAPSCGILNTMANRPTIDMGERGSVLFYRGPRITEQVDGLTFVYNEAMAVGAVFSAVGNSHSLLAETLGDKQTELGGLRISSEGHLISSKDFPLKLSRYDQIFNIQKPQPLDKRYQ